MANGNLPYSLEKSKLPVNYSCLKASVVAGVNDLNITSLRKHPKEVIINQDRKAVACLYDTSEIFYFTAFPKGNVMQICTINSGDINVALATSIDGINWDSPAGWTNVNNLTSSLTVRLAALADGEHIKVTITRNAGDYYINVLSGGDR